MEHNVYNLLTTRNSEDFVEQDEDGAIIVGDSIVGMIALATKVEALQNPILSTTEQNVTGKVVDGSSVLQK
jgi:hypothetical protein